MSDEVIASVEMGSLLIIVVTDNLPVLIKIRQPDAAIDSHIACVRWYLRLQAVFRHAS